MWNGISLLHPTRLLVDDQEFHSRASGGFGCGVIWGWLWLQYKWLHSYLLMAIAPKELIPIIMACFVWGHAWQGQVVHVHYDNESVVSVINSGCNKDGQMTHMIHCLFFVLAVWDILLYACHISGVLNSTADAISRDYGTTCLPSSNSSATGVGGSAGHSSARLGSSQLGAPIQELFAAGLALATRRSYKSGERRIFNSVLQSSNDLSCLRVGLIGICGLPL